MSEIEIGEFVRTINKGIRRIDTIFENKTVNKYGYESGSDWDGKLYSYIKTTDIANHSKNIIELIEVGDIVEVLDINWIRKIDIDDKDTLEGFKEEIEEENWKIKSILTHEQYEQNCYRLKK